MRWSLKKLQYAHAHACTASDQSCGGGGLETRLHNSPRPTQPIHHTPTFQRLIEHESETSRSSYLLVVPGQSTVVCAHEVTSLYLGNGCQKCLPFVWKQVGSALLVHPKQLMSAGEKKEVRARQIEYRVLPYLLSVKIPLRTIALTASGCFCEYARASVDPQLPPNTTHLLIPRCSLSVSMSETRCHVVLSCGRFMQYNFVCNMFL